MFNLVVSYGTNGDQKCALLYKNKDSAELARQAILSAKESITIFDEFGHEFTPMDTHIHSLSLEDTEKSIDAYVDALLRQTLVQVRATNKARQHPEMSRSPLVNPQSLPMGSPFHRQ
jgi:hypothetical protein